MVALGDRVPTIQTTLRFKVHSSSPVGWLESSLLRDLEVDVRSVCVAPFATWVRPIWDPPSNQNLG
jgi:hypothetical protein